MRRLPVIQRADTEDALAASRPSWQWVLIGAGLIVTLFAPLAVVAAPLGARALFFVRRAHASTDPMPPWAGLVVALPVVVAFALASFAGGALVGRFGGPAAPRRAWRSGIVAALGVSSVALLAGQKVPIIAAISAFAVFTVVGTIFGAWGAGAGAGRRPVLGSTSK